MKRKLKSIIAGALHLNVDEINNNTSSQTINQWCSQLQMRIVFAVEKEFGIEFDEAESMLADSYSLLQEVVMRKLNRPSFA